MHLNKKIKNAVGDEIKNFNEILEAREQEINVLKDMVRSSQSHNRTVETDHVAKAIRSSRKNNFSPNSPSPQGNVHGKIGRILQDLQELHHWSAIKLKRIKGLSNKMLQPQEIRDFLGVTNIDPSNLNVHSAFLSEKEKRRGKLFLSFETEMQ